MNKRKPKVSILMCVYNGESHVRESIDSILCQTYSDFEFVIIDDASSDLTSEILVDYAFKDSRIVLDSNEVNLGLERSLNKGLSLVRGQYFARQDADDISLPDRIEKQVRFLDSNPEIGAIGSSVKFIDSNGNLREEDHLPHDHASLRALLLFNNFMHHSTLMARRCLMQALQGYDETKRYAEDYDLWWRLSRLSRLASLPEPLLYRRLDDGPRISKKYRKQQLECAFKISLEAVQESMGSSLSDLTKDAYQRWWWSYLQVIDPDAYQNFWVYGRRDQIYLSYSDIKSLQKFWSFLANHPAGPQVWGDRLHSQSHVLLRQGRTAEGLSLLKIAVQQLKSLIQWKADAKSILKSFLSSKSRSSNLTGLKQAS